MVLYLVPVSVIEEIKKAICEKTWVYDEENMSITEFAEYIEQIYY